MFVKTGVVTLLSFFVNLIGIGSAVAFVVFVYFYDTLDNYPVCCLQKLSMLLIYSLVLLGTNNSSSYIFVVRIYT